MLNKKNVIFVLFIITMISILFGLNKMNTKTHESESLSNEFIKQRYDYYAEQDRLNSSDWIKYGNLYEGEEDYKEAMKCYENAIEKDATNALAYYSKGNMLYVFQDYEAAFENFRISSEIENANVEKSAALVSMADCYIFIDLNESINYLRQAKELDKESQYDYDGEIQFLNKFI